MKHVLVALCVLALAACASKRADIPRTYIAFFNFNAVDLSPDARAVVHQAATSAKLLKPARIELAGYSGREEDPRTAAPVADKRYAAVEAALIAEGIPPAILARVSVMDDVPLPATAVRRIEIRLIDAP